MKRSKTSKAWMTRHVNDAYVKRAKQEGYRSRAAYKLMEIAEKDKLLKSGMTVVDLGAAPGGWSQVAAQLIQPSGRVIAVDILDMQAIEGVEFLKGDFREPEVLQQLENLLVGTQVDLVISDMAPNISGIGSVDQARFAHLVELAIDFARAHLKPGGTLLVKVFHGYQFEELSKTMRQSYEQVLIRKPKASRDASSEVFLLGKGLRHN